MSWRNRPRRLGNVRARRQTVHLRKLKLLLCAAIPAAVLLSSGLYLRESSGAIALSDASDLVTTLINNTIASYMSEGDYGYDYFVTTQTDASGRITAITSNMTRINELASQILNDIVEGSGEEVLTVSLPLGNLMGSTLLLGRGPEIPVRIIMLTSSRAEFTNEIISAGINQTKHQILLDVRVDIDVLIPWETLSTQVVSEVLIAETVIVGSVPDTYLSLELDHGTTEGN